MELEIICLITDGFEVDKEKGELEGELADEINSAINFGLYPQIGWTITTANYDEAEIKEINYGGGKIFFILECNVVFKKEIKKKG